MSEYPYVYLHNEIQAAATATIAINDRGFLLGDGLFETMRCYAGNVVLLKYHWQRLLQGLKTLQCQLSFSYQQLQQTIHTLIQYNQLLDTDAIVRLTVTRGSDLRGILPSKNIEPTVLITCHALPTTPAPYRLIISDIRRNQYSPLVTMKTTNYLESILAKMSAHQQHADDAIVLNTHAHVCETSCANIFCVKDQTVATPTISDGVLPGIMRHLVIAQCQENNITLQETRLTTNELLAADEIFVTNSVLRVHPVQSINTQTYPLKSDSMTQKIANLINLFILNNS